MIKEKNINFEYIKLEVDELKDFIDPQASANQKSNMANIYKSFEIGRDGKYDLLYFLEDDYIHDQSSLSEMLFSYEKFASLIKDELILCPTDFPYLYNKFEPTQIILGNNRHWRVIEETLCTFLTSKKTIIKTLGYFCLNDKKMKICPSKNHCMKYIQNSTVCLRSHRLQCTAQI